VWGKTVQHENQNHNNKSPSQKTQTNWFGINREVAPLELTYQAHFEALLGGFSAELSIRSVQHIQHGCHRCARFWVLKSWPILDRNAELDHELRRYKLLFNYC